MQTPVLFLVFNRPRHTRAVLEQIRRAHPARLYVHCDGARTHVAGEAEKVAEVRAIIEKNVDWRCELKTLYRTENQGLRNGVFDALNWFFNAEPYGIVLEDDCVPDPSFFPFCEELLERYKDDPRVMHIGCSNLAESYTARQETSYVFTRFSFVWGWAGWRRAWKMMSPDLEGLEVFEQSGTIRHFIADKKAQAYMLSKFHATQRHENNSWAYAWFYSILKNDGICIVPKNNLVQNVGVGEEDATNTTRWNAKARLRAQQIQFPLNHPENRTPDPLLEQQFFYLSQKSRRRLWLWYVLYTLGLRN